MAGQKLCLCGGAPAGIRMNGNWNRTHGWSLPLHPLQGVAFLFLIMFALLHFGVLVPSLPHCSPWKLAAMIVVGVVFIVHIVVLLVCMTLNPGDPNVRLANASEQEPSEFDRSTRKHVILNQYCCICQTKVGIRSKHCSSCNKCISDFDHHCKWLNNCIGGRNYKLFLVCVTTALIGCLIIFLTSLSLITAYFIRTSWLNMPLSLRVYENSTKMAAFDVPMNTSINASHPFTMHHREGRVFWVFLPVTGTLWLFVVVLTSVLSLMASALLTHLLAFHVYLMIQGLSTYEYIVQKREVSTNSGQGGHFGGHGNKNTGGQLVKKGLLCPLKKWRRFKMANQIRPVAGREATKDVEVAVANSNQNGRSVENVNSSTAQNPGSHEELEQGDSASPKVPKEMRETPEQRAGNIYLGSPLRRTRILLPPIAYAGAPGQGLVAWQGEPSQQPYDNNISHDTEERQLNSASRLSALESNSSVGLGSVPSLLVSDCTEKEPPPPPILNLSSRHMSVSTQSLNSAIREEQMQEDFIHSNKNLLDARAELGGSLSNLLILENNDEMADEDNDLMCSDDVVHEVNIIQSPFHQQTKQDQLLFCTGKGNLESLPQLGGGSVDDISSHDDRQHGDTSFDNAKNTTSNNNNSLNSSAFKRRSSIDILLIPLGSDSTKRNLYESNGRARNDGTVIFLHSSENDPKQNLFTNRRTDFLRESPHCNQQQLIV